MSKIQNKISDPKPTSRIAQKGKKLKMIPKTKNAKSQKTKMVTKWKLSTYMSKLNSIQPQLNSTSTQAQSQLYLNLTSTQPQLKIN